MSTRATIIINDKDGNRAIAIYQHCDGYIHQGLGALLFQFMKARVLVNGFSFGDVGKIQSNGIGDFAAQLVTELKHDPTSPGDTSIMCEGEEIHSDVEYVYYIRPTSAEPCPMCGHSRTGHTEWEISIVKDGARIFTGTPEQAIKHFGHNPSKPLF